MREELTSAERVLIAVERWLPTAEARLAVMGDNLDLVDRILIQAARGHWTKPEPVENRPARVAEKAYDKSEPVPAWDPDNPGCAPEACGGSRLDPCSAVMRTKGASHDGEEEPSTWFLVMEGDLVLGGDGKWYEVIRNVPGIGPNWGLRVVTLDLGGLIDKTYNMRSGDAVQRLRGPASRAKQVLADAGLQPEEVQR